jgi:hypothetical protein
MDRSIHSAAAEQRRVRRIYDGVNSNFRDIAAKQFELV